MTIRTFAIAATSASLLSASAVVAQDPEATEPDLGQVVATVNGAEITLGHIAAAHAILPEQYRNLPNDVLLEGLVTQLIQQSTLAQSFEGDWPDRVVLLLDNETRQLLAGEVINNVLADAVTPVDVQNAYDEQYLSATEELEYNAAHILVATEEEAVEILGALDAGAEFEELARERSTGPSGPRGGDLGWFTEGMMVPAFEQAVLDLAVEEVSDPVQTQFGWHVILLKGMRAKEAPPFEAVEAELTQQLREAAVQAHLDELTEAATIDRTAAEVLDPSVLDTIDLSLE